MIDSSDSFPAGFKEMYCEFDNSSSFMKGAGSPRKQVHAALNELFASCDLKVGWLLVTAHEF